MDIQRFISKNLRKRSVLSYCLAPFGFIYGLVQGARRFLYDLKIIKSYNSSLTIISVGNIVSGGAGKTPFTIFLSKYLLSKNKKIVISHRGYKGDFEEKTTFISDRDSVFDFANRAGDEPYMLAQKLLGVPVIVGKDRTAAIKLIETKYPETDYVILDDSFQHLKVKHDFDFLVFNSGFGLGNGFCLPAGLLREFPKTIKVSSALIWNELDESVIPTDLLNSGKAIIKFKYQAVSLVNSLGEKVDLSEINRGKNALMSGIGYPEGFEVSCRDYGLYFEKHYKLPDHFDYKNDELITSIKNSFEREKFNNLIVTEKDWSKLKHLDSFNLPYYILKVEFQLISDNNHFLEQDLLV